MTRRGCYIKCADGVIRWFEPRPVTPIAPPRRQQRKPGYRTVTNIFGTFTLKDGGQ